MLTVEFNPQTQLLSSGFAIRPSPSLAFASPNSGIHLNVTEHSISVTWKPIKSKIGYPGFETVLGIVASIWEIGGKPLANVSTVGYSNLAEGAESFYQAVQIEGIENSILKDSVEFNVARILENSLEYRIVLKKISEGVVIFTSGGKMIPPEIDPIILTSEQIHDPMQDLFDKLLTGKQKDDWKYSGIKHI